jgi:hypothetical protein
MLYWTDAVREKIERATLSGTNREVSKHIAELNSTRFRSVNLCIYAILTLFSYSASLALHWYLLSSSPVVHTASHDFLGVISACKVEMKIE